MKKKMYKLTVLSMILSATSFAGGFKIGLQGQKQVGMGTVGTGIALDASSVYFNPGAIGENRNQIAIGVFGLMPKAQYLDASTQITTDAVAQTFTPFAAYGTYGLNKKITLGLGAYTPFGSGIKYPTGWTGRYILTEIGLQTVFLQPTVSYSINSNLSLGAGFIYAIGNVNLQNDIPVQGQNITEPGHVALKGHANGMGMNAGVYYKKNKLSAGLVYRSKLGMSVSNGTNTFTNIPFSAASSFPSGTFSSTLNLPGEIGLGIGYKISDKFLIAADFNYTMWNVYDTLKFDFATNTSSVADVASARLYEDASAFKLGAQYAVNKKTNLRAGAFYDMTPIQDNYVSPELPDNDKTGLTFGASYKTSERLSLDASFLYENLPARKVTNISNNLSGTYASKIVAIGLGVSYKFNKKTTTK
jgi:long-chain fatty acid transport protein